MAAADLIQAQLDYQQDLAVYAEERRQCDEAEASWRGSLLSGGRYMRHERPLGSGNGSGYPHPDLTATSGVGARAAVTPVSTRASVQRIPALHAEQPVAAWAAEEPISAVTAAEDVVAAFAAEHVVSTLSVDDVVAGSPDEGLAAVGALDRDGQVVAGARRWRWRRRRADPGCMDLGRGYMVPYRHLKG